jgi:outer membrane receptor for ferric coprogen and ferric-rhodotorulic acid
LAAGFTHVQMQDKDGKAINTYLPRNTLRLRTTYRLPGEWSRLTLGGGVSWQSVTWANVNGVPTGRVGADGRAVTESRRIVQNAFWLLNLSAHYQFSNSLSASLNINNALDKKYYSRVGFYSGVTWGTPRDIRVNLRYTF